MSRNSLEFTYPAEEDAFDAFAEPVSERKIVAWVMELDATLDRQLEQLPGADVRSVLYEAIRRGLDVRKADAMDIVRAPTQTMDVLRDASDDNHTAAEPGHHVVAPPDARANRPKLVEHVTNQSSATLSVSLKAEDEGMSDFGMSQFVDFDIEAIGDDAAPSKDAGEEFGEDIEDDMLLDL